MKRQSKTRSQTAKDWGKILLPALLFMVGQILLQQVLSILFSTLWPEYTSAFPGVPGAASSCLLTPVILFGYFKTKPAKKKCSFTVTRQKVVFWILWMIFVFCIALASTFVQIQTTHTGPDDHMNSVIEIFAVVISGPINEELIYRGFVLEQSRKVLRPLWAVMLCAILFGAAHRGGIQIGTAIVVGMLLCLIVLRVNSLFAAVLAHMGLNALSFWDGLYRLPAAIYIIGILGVILLGSVFVFQIRQHHQGIYSEGE